MFWLIILLLVWSSSVAGGYPPALAAPSTSSITYAWTGSEQTYTVPTGVHSLQIDACGAQGGPDPFTSSTLLGGLGGRIQSLIPVTPGQILYVAVGGSGSNNYNGGGLAMDTAYTNGYGSSTNKYAGGATDIRTTSGGSTGLSNLATGSDSRLVVAGGGGWGCTFNHGGIGGGLVGGDSGCDSNSCNTGGLGGTQSVGGGAAVGSYNAAGYTQYCSGSLGAGGDCTNCGGRGGGGGYFGGGCGQNGGGGGSSFTISTGMFVINTQGYSGCNGYGVLYVTPVISPSSVPTIIPTPSPTPSPTKRYSAITDAQLVVMTLHKGMKCESHPDPLGYFIKSYSLGSCTPTNNLADHYHPYVLSCLKAWSGTTDMYTIRKDSYSDFACTVPVDNAIMLHENFCQDNHIVGLPGGSMKANCVSGLEMNLWKTRPQLLTRSYQSPTCSGGMRKTAPTQRLCRHFSEYASQ